MNHPDEELRKAVALFRYGLIADVLRVPLGSREIRRALHEKAQRTYIIPGTRRTRVAVETMRDWLSLYRTGGFEALYPKTRADRGQPRRLPPELAELLVSLKTEQPALSVNALIGVARERGVDYPLDQWALCAHNVRYPDPATDLDDLFLFEAKRRVMKDRTLSLHARLYEVDAVLVGQTVTLRYDPHAPASRPIDVVHDGKCAGQATRLDAYANTKRACEASGTSPSNATAPPGSSTATPPRANPPPRT